MGGGGEGIDPEIPRNHGNRSTEDQSGRISGNQRVRRSEDQRTGYLGTGKTKKRKQNNWNNWKPKEIGEP